MGGTDKLVRPVSGGDPLLIRSVQTALKTGQQVWVALPARKKAPKRWDLIAQTAAHVVEIANPKLGLSASITVLFASLPASSNGAMIFPADMPDLTTDDLCKVLAAFAPDTVVRGAANGKPGHPVLFPASWFSRLSTLKGDVGARDVLKKTSPKLVPLPENHALTDLDTLQDWQEWQAKRDPV